MQKLFLAGNCGKDAELRTLGNGDPVLNFSLAIDNGKDRDGNRRDSTWYDCSLFGKRAAGLAPHIRKGDRLTLIGRPTVRVHEGKAYLGISVDDLTFMGSANRDAAGPSPSPGTADDYREKRQAANGGHADLDDDVPFAPEWRA
jgi:single-strand DNA-binding protein